MIDLNDKKLKSINIFIWILLLFELPVVAVNFTKYGIAEKTMGAYTQTGAMTTMLPIAVIFYMAAYYIIYQPKIRYILTGIGYILFSIVGAKKAVAFLYPLQFILIYYFMYGKQKGKKTTKKLMTGIFVVCFSLFITGSIFIVNRAMNPERRTGGSIDTEHVIDFALRYETREDEYGNTGGRLSTTLRIFSLMNEKGVTSIFFGFGPGQGVKAEKYGIVYGTTSMTRIILEHGIFGVIAYGIVVLVLAQMCRRYYYLENDTYWKAFAAGSVGLSIAMIFFFGVYNPTAFWGDTMPALYFYAMAVVKTRFMRITRKEGKIETNLLIKRQLEIRHINKKSI